jgi:hypothetical protein
MSDDVTSWADIYAALFNRRLTDGDANGFAAVIATRIPNPAKGEIKSACLALAKTWQTRTKDNGYASPPTAQDILTQMVRSRHEMSQGSSGRQCDHCNNGWMSFRFHVHDAGEIKLDGKQGTPLHPADETDGMPTSCPCVCSLGTVIVSQLVTAGTEQSRIDKLRHAVFDARKDYMRGRTEVQTPNDVDKLARSVSANVRKVDMMGSEWEPETK